MIVDISELSVSYDGIGALEKISFGINKGDFLGIIGPKRCRKIHIISLHVRNSFRISGNDQIFQQRH